MPGHLADFIAVRDSPGLILIPQRTPIRRIIADLILLWAASHEQERQNTILYLPL